MYGIILKKGIMGISDFPFEMEESDKAKNYHIVD